MPSAAEKTIATSLKLPAPLKAQIDAGARKAGISTHAFMVKTLSEATDRAQLRQQFEQDTADAWNEVEATGLSHRLEDVETYFRAKAAWRRGEGPKPERLIPSREE